MMRQGFRWLLFDQDSLPLETCYERGLTDRLLHHVAGRAEQLQVVQVIRAVLRLGDDVIPSQVAKWEVALATRTVALLLSVERVPVRLVGRQLAHVRALRNIGLESETPLISPPLIYSALVAFPSRYRLRITFMRARFTPKSHTIPCCATERK